MKRFDTQEEMLERVAALLSDSAYVGHPLYEALEQLHDHYRDQQYQLGRLISISDGYQKLAVEAREVIEQRHWRTLRRQRKLSRISDGYQAIIHERNHALHRASTLDPLTQLANRRLINEHLLTLEATGKPYTLALLDIDHFKTINDSHGHDVGDQLLVAIADVMRQTSRESDLCGRWGGEEFLLIFNKADLSEAWDIVERIRKLIADVSVNKDGQKLSVTLSAGLSEALKGESHTETLERADQALLRAKRKGRDRSLADTGNQPTGSSI